MAGLQKSKNIIDFLKGVRYLLTAKQEQTVTIHV